MPCVPCARFECGYPDDVNRGLCECGKRTRRLTIQALGGNLRAYVAARPGGSYFMLVPQEADAGDLRPVRDDENRAFLWYFSDAEAETPDRTWEILTDGKVSPRSEAERVLTEVWEHDTPDPFLDVCPFPSSCGARWIGESLDCCPRCGRSLYPSESL